MSFETDKQTLEDLNILGRYKTGSIFNMYDGIVTREGERFLERMFNNPLSDAKQINDRSSIFSYFKENKFTFPFTPAEFDSVDQYIIGGGVKNPLLNIAEIVKIKAMKIIANLPDYELLEERAILAIGFIEKSTLFFKELYEKIDDNIFKSEIEKGIKILADPIFKKLLSIKKDIPSFTDILKYDYIMRHKKSKEFSELLHILSSIDVYVAVGNIANENNFCCAKAFSDSDSIFEITNLRHPRIKNAKGNDLSISVSKNVFFLTGANMAGKSTLMKSFGISVYLAHMGFPVAADSMDFLVRDGMYTSINVPDDISKGYSHFYAEVLRVKNVAIEVSKSKKLLVIFDELFKGTNVKDAYDATLAVTEALAKKTKCAYVVSTHIIEVGEELGRKCDNVNFFYLPTIMEGAVPVYTYKLEKGITEDKHGMIIINNEKIIEIIKGEV